MVTRESGSTSAPPIAFHSSGTIMEPGHLASCYYDSREKAWTCHFSAVSFQAIGRGIKKFQCDLLCRKTLIA